MDDEYIEDPLNFPTDEELSHLPPEDQIGWLVDWFGYNFSDPVHEMSYNGSEGGYLYLFGGPFSTADELYDRFSLSDEIVQAAKEIIESEGTLEWAPSQRRTSLMRNREQGQPDYYIFSSLPEGESVGRRSAKQNDLGNLSAGGAGHLVDDQGQPIKVARPGIPFDDGSYFDDGAGFDDGEDGSGPPNNTFGEGDYGTSTYGTADDETDARRFVRLDIIRMRALLDQAPAAIPGIGHNKPPDFEEDDSLRGAIAQLTSAVTLLTAQLENEEPDKAEVAQSHGLITSAVGTIKTVASNAGLIVASVAADRYWDDIIRLGAQFAHHVAQWAQLIF